jgi:hypothetical protein
LRRLRLVFVKKFEQLSSRVVIKSMGESGHGGWDLETLVEDDLVLITRRWIDEERIEVD